MYDFDIYRKAGSGEVATTVEVVKRGFSWPGFFFSGIWALVKHLWLYGVVLLIVLVPLNFTSMYAADEGPGWLWAGTTMLGLAIAIGVGHYGNDWRRRNLQGRGFVEADTVEAQNDKEALAVAAVEHQDIAAVTGEHAPQRRFSIGGVIVSGILFLSLISNTVFMLTSDRPGGLSMLLGMAVPAVALLIRSFRPPVGFLRGLAVVLGGMTLGMMPMPFEMAMFVGRVGGETFFIALIYAALGGFLLWVGFKPVKAKTTKQE